MPLPKTAYIDESMIRSCRREAVSLVTECDCRSAAGRA